MESLRRQNDEQLLNICHHYESVLRDIYREIRERAIRESELEAQHRKVFNED